MSVCYGEVIRLQDSSYIEYKVCFVYHLHDDYLINIHCHLVDILYF